MPYFPAKIAPSYKARKVGPQSNLSHIIRPNQPPNIGVRGEAPNPSRSVGAAAQSAPMNIRRCKTSFPSFGRPSPPVVSRKTSKARPLSINIVSLLHENVASLIISHLKLSRSMMISPKKISKINRQVFMYISNVSNKIVCLLLRVD